LFDNKIDVELVKELGLRDITEKEYEANLSEDNFKLIDELQEQIDIQEIEAKQSAMLYIVR